MPKPRQDLCWVYRCPNAPTVRVKRRYGPLPQQLAVVKVCDEHARIGEGEPVPLPRSRRVREGT